MSNRDPITVAGGMIANIAVAGALAAASIASAATVAAEPPPPLPADPTVPAPPPAPAGRPVQTGMPAVGPVGVPQAPMDELLLGQNPVPSAPGGPPGIPPNLNFFNNSYLLPQNEVPSAPGEGQMFDVAPGQENADTSHRDYLKRVWHLYQGDRLKGSLLGQMPQEQLSAPLPGTAPPPRDKHSAGAHTTRTADP
jgi:hypothetical protein